MINQKYKTYHFTLLEVVLVISLLGLVASTMLLTVDNFQDQSRYDQTLYRMELIKKALIGNKERVSGFVDGYIADTGQLPTAENWMTELTTAESDRQTGASGIPNEGLTYGRRGKYIHFDDEEINDGWGQPFELFVDVTTKDITIKSLGADRAVDINDSSDPGYEESNNSYNKDFSISINSSEFSLVTSVSIIVNSLKKRNGVKARIIYPDGNIINSDNTASFIKNEQKEVTFTFPSSSSRYFKHFYIELWKNSNSFSKEKFNQSPYSNELYPSEIMIK